MKNLYYVEETDTYGGESNYSWVNRIAFEVPENASTRTVVRLAKKAMGWKGRHVTFDYGDMIRLDLRNANVCAFVEKLNEEYYRHEAALEDWKNDNE